MVQHGTKNYLMNLGDAPIEPQLALRSVPAGRPVMRQSWRHLLFLHWRLDAADIQPTLPPGLTVETFDGSAWMGVVPFFMRRIRPAGLPAVPGISNFLELNLRTYVVDEAGRPGVWFFSLDANQWLAVKVARTFFKLPYEHARMEATVEEDGTVDYRSHRRGSPAAFASRFRYRPWGSERIAELDSIDFFLLERYLLYAWNPKSKRLNTGRVHHSPYPLRNVDTPVYDAHLFTLDGFIAPTRSPDHTVYSAGVDVAVFGLEAGVGAIG